MALQMLQSLIWRLGFECPIETCEVHGEWLVCQLSGMHHASQEAVNLALQGYYMKDGVKIYSVGEPEKLYYHGTSVSGCLSILQDKKFKVLEPHHPTGIYSYPSSIVSGSSCYTAQGVELSFSSKGIVLSLSDSRSLDFVPSGFIARMKRSAAKRHGAGGFEHIHHPNNCHILFCRFHLPALHSFMQSSDVLDLWPTSLAAPVLLPAMSSWNNKQQWGSNAWGSGSWPASEKKGWNSSNEPIALPDAWATPGGSSSSGQNQQQQPQQPVAELANAVMQLAQAVASGGTSSGRELIPAMKPPAGAPPATTGAGTGLGPFQAPGGWPAVQQAYFGPGLQVDHSVVHRAAVKMLIMGALGLRPIKLRFCWKCYSVSWFSPGSMCAAPGCMSFGFNDAHQILIQQSHNRPLQDLYLAVTADIIGQISPGCNNPLSLNNINMDSYVWPILQTPDAGEEDSDDLWSQGDGWQPANAPWKAPGKAPEKAAGKPPGKAPAKAGKWIMKPKGKAKAKGKAPVQAKPLVPKVAGKGNGKGKGMQVPPKAAAKAVPAVPAVAAGDGA